MRYAGYQDHRGLLAVADGDAVGVGYGARSYAGNGNTGLLAIKHGAPRSDLAELDACTRTSSAYSAMTWSAWPSKPGGWASVSR